MVRGIVADFWVQHRWFPQTNLHNWHSKMAFQLHCKFQEWTALGPQPKPLRVGNPWKYVSRCPFGAWIPLQTLIKSSAWARPLSVGFLIAERVAVGTWSLFATFVRLRVAELPLWGDGTVIPGLCLVRIAQRTRLSPALSVNLAKRAFIQLLGNGWAQLRKHAVLDQVRLTD